MTVIYFAGLEERAARYQRDAAQASAEAMDLRIALGRMGRAPSTDEAAMAAHFDEVARATSARATEMLALLLDVQRIHWPIAA
jgi:hypothetical protein